MPVDASVYSNIRPLDIVGSIASGLRLKDLSLQTNEKQRIADQDQAVRDAYRQNVGSDGQIDRQGVLSDLAKVDPERMMQAQTSFAQMDQAALQRRSAQISDKINQLGMVSQLAGTAKDQPSYDQALQQAKNIGIDTSQMPQQFDPGLMRQYAFMASDQKDRLQAMKEQHDEQMKEGDLSVKQGDLAVKQGELGVKKGELGARWAEVGKKKEEKQSQNQDKSFMQTTQLLETARGSPAVAQAEKDIYAADKVNSLANLYKDPNNLSPQQVQLIASEVGKIASGGVPSMHELEGLTPSTLQSKFASITSQLTNNPTPANAAAFVKQYQDYTNSLAKDAQKVITDRYGRVIESRKKQLGDDNYGALKKIYVDRFNQGGDDNSSPVASAAKQMAAQAGTSSGVRMIAPDGSVRTVPAERVGEAIAAGGKRAQ